MDLNLVGRVKFLEWSVQRHEFRYLRNCLDHEKLYKGDPRLLLFVANQEGSSQARIAKGLCVKPASLTIMIQRMEAAGLIRRQPDEKDMRTQRVYITEEGRETAMKTMDVFKKAVREIYGGITEEELKTYLGIMEKIQSNMDGLTRDMPREQCTFEAFHCKGRQFE